MAKTRISANLSKEALGIIAAYQAKNSIKDRGSAIPWAEPDEVCAIVIAKSNSGQLESILATMNDRYYY